MRRIALLVFPLILITVVFLISIFIISRDSGNGALQVTSTPSSRVYLDGKYVGDTPLCKCKLNDMVSSGEHNIRLDSKEGGFPRFEEKITVSPSVLTVVDRTFGREGESSGSIISLSPINDKKLSPILVTSFPNKTDVLIDSKKEGTTPISIENLTASDHEVTLRKSSYKTKTLRVRTVAGYRLDIVAYLGLGESVSSPSAQPVISVQKIRILDTPTGFLRVRESSSSAAPQIGEVLPGEEYDLIEEVDDWYRIKLKDDRQGWISKTYAEKL